MSTDNITDYMPVNQPNSRYKIPMRLWLVVQNHYFDNNIIFDNGIENI